MRTFCFFAFFLLQAVLYAQPDPIEPFTAEIDFALRKMKRSGSKMTVNVRRHIPHSDYSPVIQVVTYRFLNDSVYERSYDDRLIGKRKQFVIRENETLPWDRKKQRAVVSETVTRKDSAGYTVELRRQKRRKDSVTFYSRSRIDTVRRCTVTWSRNSLQPGMEQECETCGDTLIITREYRSSGGDRRLVRQIEFRRRRGGIMHMTDELTTTVYGDDPSQVSVLKVVSHYQNDTRGRPELITKLEYRDGSENYSLLLPLTIHYGQ